MTNLAIFWLGRDSRISVVTSETDRVADRDCLERALL